jgi:hypothetical protein
MLGPMAKWCPKSPTLPPTKKGRTLSPIPPVSADVIQLLTPQFNPRFAEAYAVDCSDFYERMAERRKTSNSSGADSDDMKASMQAIPGRYFKVADTVNGGVFRQERPFDDDAPNTSMLFLHCVDDIGHESGWYISTHLDIADPRNVTHAWGKIGDNGLVPESLHVPFWSKTWNNEVLIQPLLIHNEDRITALSEECAQLRDELVLRHDKDKDKDKGKGQGKHNKGAGWMNRTVPLAVAIMSDDLDEAKTIVEDYTNKYNMFNVEVEKGLARRLENAV